jgi:hypothetical protein
MRVRVRFGVGIRGSDDEELPAVDVDSLSLAGRKAAAE